MNYPKTADEWISHGSSQRKKQRALNKKIKAAFDEIVRIGYECDPIFWDDYLHSPRDIDGSSTDQRWNENTLSCMEDAIEDAMELTQLENAVIDEINIIWDEGILYNERIYNGELCTIHAPITITPTRVQGCPVALGPTSTPLPLKTNDHRPLPQQNSEESQI